MTPDSLTDLSQSRAKARDEARALAAKIGRGWSINETTAGMIIDHLARGEDPGILASRAKPEDMDAMREVAARVSEAESKYGAALAAMSQKKEPWELTKAEAGHAVVYGDMRAVAPIGAERVFYRVGDLPKGGRSFNTMTQTYEDGASVYVTPTVGSLAGEVERPWYYGRGKVVGYGGDDEPVIEPTGEWGKYPGHKSVVKSALTAGQPVPAEVLADYPDLAAKHPVAANGVRYVNGVPQKGEQEKAATKVKRTSTSGQGDISGDLLHTDTLKMPSKGQAVDAKIEIVKLDSAVNGFGYAMVADAAGQTRWRLFKSEDDARAELAKSKEQSAKQFGASPQK